MLFCLYCARRLTVNVMIKMVVALICQTAKNIYLVIINENYVSLFHM